MNLETIIQLRKTLHSCPEVSGQEVQTKALLIDFLNKHTTLEIHPCGDGFYAAHREPSGKLHAIALRADYDALAMPDGTAKHLCGHDGHAAALCGVALFSEGKTFNRDIFFLFQPAEETGAGAEGCLELFSRESVGEIYGAHNLPGLPLGLVTTRPGTFACASRGLTLFFRGKPSHAAYPENGRSPASAVGKLLCALPKLSDASQYTGMILCTVIGVEMGSRSFGASAANAEVRLTLRAEHDHDLMALQDKILNLSKASAEQGQISFSYQLHDVFPATENTSECAQKVLTRCEGRLLETPMRWSEDFGHYLTICPGAFFGIGAGGDCPQLHTENYEYPDALLRPTIEALIKLL